MITKNIVPLIFVFLSTLIIETKEGSLMIYESRYFYCNGRIYADNYYLSVNEINSLCSLISSDDRYVVLFTNKDSVMSEASYISTSETFFSSQCLSNSINCKYDFAISIFLNGGKVIITSGSIAQNIVSKGNRMNIINNMVTYLRSREYYTAIYQGITQISKIFYQNGGGKYPHQNNPEPSKGHSTFTIIFFLLILCCCILGCYFCYKNQQKSNEELTYTQIIEAKSGQNGNDNYNQALQIHNHLTALENIIKEIRESEPPVKNTNLCFICFQPIVNTPGVINSANTRFACQHVYHSNCLGMKGLQKCLMCLEDTVNCSTIIGNTYDTQTVNEQQVKNFIKNLQNIYPPQQLQIYCETYPQEYRSYNEGLMVGMLASAWLMPPIVVVGPGYYGGFGYGGYGGYEGNYPHQYGENANYNNPNPDSAVGGFESQQNIEMTEYQNNGNNNIGNFGNNNTNDMGNFGGSGNDGGGDFGADGGDF